MALSNIIVGTLGAGLLMAPMASAPTTELIRLRAIATTPSVVAALRDHRDLPPVTYDLRWEQRLLALEQAARSP
jgi:hypothetical protein